MPVTTNSSSLPSSRRGARGPAGARKGRASAPPRSRGAVVAIALVLTALSAAAIGFFYSHGYLLYYGDATAHLNIARRLLDSRTPGWGQVGTVWLPLPHLLMLPFAAVDSLWRTGLAGSIPAGACFVISGVFLFLAARRVFNDQAAAAAACLMLAFNPNLLYLQSIPMTEAVFQACLTALLYFTVRFRETQGRGAVVGAALASAGASLTRYEGWFLIPFVALYFLAAARERRWKTAIWFGALASVAPLGWMAHNFFFYGNALSFYNGPGSAKAIYQQALDANMARYPGDHDWPKAVLYVREAIRLCAGAPLVWLGVVGTVAALLKRVLWPLVLLALVPFFYILSLHSGGTPIFMPHMWPVGAYYNTRYGVAALPLAAFAAGALVALAPRRLKVPVAAVLVLAAAAPWFGYPRVESWICWKESQVNSEARRAWTGQTADYLRANYQRGDGILTMLGDVAGVYQQAGIPLRETLNECNWPIWQKLTGSALPDVREKWAVAIAGDTVAQTISKARKSGSRYDLVKTISVKGAPVVEVYRRQS
jgi:hypothetical protein